MTPPESERSLLFKLMPGRDNSGIASLSSRDQGTKYSHSPLFNVYSSQQALLTDSLNIASQHFFYQEG